ncbi:hypothetical protein GEU84_003960 [Fertoebacter nigrum]|uniref:MSP domain-containing protein n=1 Tax=Fertoeibacter niger TaxID=2656921 RepID=A0A8X8GZS3_9RHOB|nr:hypothetical protein [Fertoeibacter niger]
MNRMTLLAALLATALPAAAFAQEAEEEENELGLAGLLSSNNREDMPGLTLSAGQPIAAGPITLKSGKYYTLEITADGSQELALSGPEFFRAIWLNEIVIEGIEIRPMAIDSLEFDEAGEAEVSFVAVKPGSYYLMIPGTTGDSQRVAITIE